MLKVIKNIALFFVVLFLAIINGQTNENNIIHRNEESSTKYFVNIIPSPVKHHITQIKMLSSNLGFAAGVYFPEYNGIDWELRNDTDILRNITCFYALDERNIYLSKIIDPLSQSELYFYDGKTVKKLLHPFGNAITTIFVTPKGKIWIGGDREIAFYDGNWHNLPFPVSQNRVRQIFANDENEAWINTLDNKLFFYSNHKWTQYLSNDNVKYTDFKNIFNGYILAGDRILKITDFSVSLIGTSPILNNATGFYTNNDGTIWLIGNSGLILRYIDQKLEIIPSNVKVNLNSLSFVSENEIWVSGEYGTILKISDKKISSNYKKEISFIGRQPVTYARNLDDQYGAAIEDLNNDGFKDIFIACIFNPNILYINNLSDSSAGTKDLNLSFHEGSVGRNTSGVISGNKSNTYSKLQLGVGVADIDNDGDEDIYICSLMDNNKLLLNDGNGYFRDVSAQSGRGTGEPKDRTNAAVFSDVDNDGDLDLFITNEYSTNRLYENNGNGYFKEITSEAGLSSIGGSMGASFADVDNDGFTDLCVANWARENNIYKNVTNDSGIKFIDITESAGIGGDSFAKSNAVVFADYNNDGMIDLFITNRGSFDRLYKNLGNFKFIDVTEITIGLRSLQSYGAEFGDFDNDGKLELYIANVGKNLMLKDSGNGSFADVTFRSGTELETYSTGTSMGDLDNDGDLDLYCSSFTGGSSALFINNADNNKYITINLEGTKSNRDAVGAKVWFYRNGFAKQQKYLLGYRQVICGTGYCSHDSKEIHFGTGNNDSVDIVISFSPESPEKIFRNIKAGTRLFILEEAGFSGTLTLFKKALIRFFIDPEIRVELLKFLFGLILIIVSIVNGREKYKWNLRYIFLAHGTGAFVFTSLILIFMHREFFLSVFVPIIFIVIYIVLIHLVFERVILVKRIKLEREITRNKIARDLHDDLASTISGSKLYLEVLSNSISTDIQSKNILSHISTQLSEAYEKISDLVWTISPLHDSLKDLIARIRYHIREQCETNKIAYKNFSNIEEKDYSLTDEIRRNVYYIFKEACHNSLLHSEAKEITLSTTLSDKVLKIQFEDNGKGIDDSTLELIKSGKTIPGSLHGNGFNNILKRAAEIGGVIEISSHPEIGTSISLELKMR